MTSSKLIESAVAALRGITSPPELARSVRDAADDIERTWQRLPFVCGLAGDLGARTELINLVAGERVLDPAARVPGCAALRVKRGKITRCRAPTAASISRSFRIRSRATTSRSCSAPMKCAVSFDPRDHGSGRGNKAPCARAQQTEAVEVLAVGRSTGCSR